MDQSIPLNEIELPKSFPPGPLDEYRKQASFDWKEMQIIIEDEKLLRQKVKSISFVNEQHYCSFGGKITAVKLFMI